MMKRLCRIFTALAVFALFLCIGGVLRTEAKTKAKISEKEKTVYSGDTFTLTLTGTKIKKSSSSKKTVATVKKGVVTAKKGGTATITLTGTNGKKYKCKVTVIQLTSKKTKWKSGKTKQITYTDPSGKTIRVKKYTRAGKLSSVIRYEYGPSGVLDCKKEYNSKDVLICEMEYSGGFVLRRTDYSGKKSVQSIYRSAGNLSAKRYFTGTRLTKEEFFRDDATLLVVQKYDKSGKFSSVETYSEDGSSVVSTAEYKYGKNSVPKSITYRNADGSYTVETLGADWTVLEKNQFDSEGVLKVFTEYREDGSLLGTTEYYPDGAVMTTRSYSSTEVLSGSKTYYKTGELMTAAEYDADGMPVRSTNYYESGAKKSIDDYTDGVKRSTVYYDESGIMLYTHDFDREGTLICVTYYNPDGSIKASEEP